MGRITVEVRIRATIERVWDALTQPDQVEAWAGVSAQAVPAGYPAAGQHARWRARLGPVSLTLHDRVLAVEPPCRLAAELDLGPSHVSEEYRLATVGLPGEPACLVVSDNVVRARLRLPGLGRLADRVVRADVEAAMDRLRHHCEGG